MDSLADMNSPATWLELAEDKLDHARRIFDIGLYDDAVSRAYYAMFYTAEALLNEKGFQFGKHGNVIGAYGRHFAKTKELDPKFHRWLLTSFDQRQIGDYAFDPNVENNVVVQMIFQAQEFLEAAKKYLGEE